MFFILTVKFQKKSFVAILKSILLLQHSLGHFVLAFLAIYRDPESRLYRVLKNMKITS